MKPDIHPEYTDVKFTCSCGNSFTAGSTLGEKAMHIEVCSKCHPFYTGKQKVVTSNRILEFNKKYKRSQGKDTAAPAA